MVVIFELTFDRTGLHVSLNVEAETGRAGGVDYADLTATGHLALQSLASGAGSGLARVARGALVPVIARDAVGRIQIRARTSGRIANPGVTLIERCADDRYAGGAQAGLTGVVLGACVAVGVTAGAVCLRRVRAEAGRRVTGPDDMALVGSGADDGGTSRADPVLTAVVLGAGAVVGVARRVVWSVQVRAGAGRRVADACDVTLVERGADDRVAARADPRQAGVGLRAGVAVVTGSAGRLETVVGTAPGPVAGVLVDACGAGITAEGARRLVVGQTGPAAVAGVRVGAFGVGRTAAGGAGRLETVVGTAPGPVAGVLVDACGAGISAEGARRLVVGQTGPAAVAGVRVGAFGVSRTAAGGAGRRETVGRTGGAGPRAVLSHVAVAGRGAADGCRRGEGVGRAAVIHAVTALGDIAGACRGPTDGRALRVSRTGGTRARAGFSRVAGAGRRAADRRARLEAIVDAEATAIAGVLVLTGAGSTAAGRAARPWVRVVATMVGDFAVVALAVGFARIRGAGIAVVAVRVDRAGRGIVGKLRLRLRAGGAGS